MNGIKTSPTQRSAEIARIVNKLHEYWESHPDKTLGQIVVNAVASPLMPSPHIWDFKDENMEQRLDFFLEGKGNI